MPINQDSGDSGELPMETGDVHPNYGRASTDNPESDNASDSSTLDGIPRTDEDGKVKHPEVDAARPRNQASGSDRDPADNQPPRTGPASTGADGGDPDVQTRERLASAVNNFHGPVIASGSIFGIAHSKQESQRRRARTGRLTGEDINAALDHYIPPRRFWDAVDALKKDRVTVLVGSAGTGKAAGAIAVLRQVTNGSLAVLSPTITISELAEREFKSGLGYVVMDWQHDRPADDVTDFAWRTLRDQVCDEHAHLVITTTSTRTRGTVNSVRHIDWELPEPRDLLASYLNGTPVEFLIDDIIGELPEGCGITAIVGLARRLLAGEDPVMVLEELGSDAAERVQKWFAAEHPLTEILEVIATAFGTGRSERAFEDMLARLERTAEKAGYALDDSDIGRKRKKTMPKPLRPVRAVRSRAGGLICRETIVIEGSARSIVKFRAEAYRYHVLSVGWHNYDGTFWSVVRDWLNAVVQESATGKNADAQMTAAAGLATLARVDMGEVEESYLHPWAGGSLGWPGQLTATYVLWWMCFDDTLAPVALRIATKWATTGDAARRWTAEATFSGELGLRYPTEATNRLWHLTEQATDGTDGIYALAQLFATLTASGQNAGQVLALLHSRVGVIGSGHRDLRRQNLIMLAALAVLSVRDVRSGLPAITLFLHTHPDRREIVAALWASVLRYRPLRRRALMALIDAATAFDNAGEKPEADAQALGDALGNTLKAGEHEQLAIDLLNLDAHRKRKRQDATRIMNALIAALERLNTVTSGESNE